MRTTPGRETRRTWSPGSAALGVVLAIAGGAGACADAERSGGGADTAVTDADDTAAVAPDANPAACPALHPIRTERSLHAACPTDTEGLRCGWPADGCADGAKPANTCVCERGWWVCSRPFHNCLPISVDAATGFVDGMRPPPRRRVPTEACADPAATATDVACTPRYFEDGTSTCATHADCGGGGSLCLDTHTFGAGSVCTCHTPACRTHDDCGPGRVCKCGMLDPGEPCEGFSDVPCGHRCIAADCRSDADCGEGGLCAGAPDVCGWPTLRYACHDPERAECLSDDECFGALCSYDAAAAGWRCADRPLCE